MGVLFYIFAGRSGFESKSSGVSGWINDLLWKLRAYVYDCIYCGDV
jgi:hypothetical protein